MTSQSGVQLTKEARTRWRQAGSCDSKVAVRAAPNPVRTDSQDGSSSTSLAIDGRNVILQVELAGLPPGPGSRPGTATTTGTPGNR